MSGAGGIEGATQREHGSERARGYVSERGRGSEGATQRENGSERAGWCVNERGQGSEGAAQRKNAGVGRVGLSVRERREGARKLRRGRMGASVQAGGLVCECAGARALRRGRMGPGELAGELVC